MERVGRIGEAQAAAALRRLGYAVHWVNRGSESGFPFDLVVRKLSGNVSDADRQGEARWFAELLDADGLLDQTRVTHDINHGYNNGDGDQPGPRFIYVEVKASVLRSKDLFEVSLLECATAWQMGSKYWVVRVDDVAGARHEVKVVRDLSDALNIGAAKLWLVA